MMTTEKRLARQPSCVQLSVLLVMTSLLLVVPKATQAQTPPAPSVEPAPAPPVKPAQTPPVPSAKPAPAPPVPSAKPAPAPAPSAKPLPIGCVLRGQHPRIELAGFAAHAAKLQFRSESGRFWYSVELARRQNRWVAVLPRPTTATRIHYRLIAYNRAGKIVQRLPRQGAFFADVVTRPCVGVTAPIETAPTISLTAPARGRRVPQGFDSANISAFVAATAPVKRVAPTPKKVVTHRGPRYLLTTGTRVRITEKSGASRTGKVGHTSTSGVDFGGSHLDWSSVAGVEVYEPASGGARLLGGMAGLGGGFVIAILYYVSVEDIDSSAPLYLFTIGGGLLGATIPSGRWQQVSPVSGAHASSSQSGDAPTWNSPQVTLIPRRGGAQVGLSFGF